ncbi:helix-turn-helix domain-containing protein [Amantichitinum ursilacus]|uniref:Helix-turn-helix protein domain protein n=1 Tax=Amantichitinum ursilacus TaxID=857265 RepID=A0A0N0XJJ0_9NEIS|nr:helix-turn-helix domain-containing protein [Amantichitinum ursilacus]KPC53738.1 helix-turn-helix protein domain protein [Amantichitinum ursilacus]
MRKVKALPFPTKPDIDSADDIGRFIRAARTASGITLEMAALHLGVSKQTLSDIELGKATVGIGLVLHAAREFGLSLMCVSSKQRALLKHQLLSTVATDKSDEA